MSNNTIPATRIYRYEVPVDDQVHEFTLHSDPLAVACRDPRIVEFWALHLDDPPGLPQPRRFLVVGTGHPIPVRLPYHDGFSYIGTAVAPGAQLVWHLLEVAS